MCTINGLIELTGSDKLPVQVVKNISLLLEAVNDWPKQIEVMPDFVSHVGHYLNCEVTIEAIDRKLKNINYSKEAWIAESLSSIRELLLLNPNRSLDQILKEIYSFIKTSS